MRRLLVFAGLLPAMFCAFAQGGGDFEKRVTEFNLPNGLHWIVLERHESPVISFHTYVRAGAADVPGGETGLARLIERLAWDGTDTIGTTDAAAEKKAIAAVEEVYDRLQSERNKGRKASDGTVAALNMQYRLALDRARAYAKPGEYSRVLTEAGAAGLAATAGADGIEYTCTLPSNRLELWFTMESQRLARPLFRSFYQQRDRLADELRAPAQGQEEARLLDQLSAAAFAAHPYRNPVSGWPGDPENLRVADANAFVARYFAPGNITVALAGDVNPAEARRLAERYFGPIPARALPPQVHPQEPAQTGPRVAVAATTSAPLVAIGYKRPDQFDRDDTALDLVETILAAGPESWLRRDLVQEKKVIASARVEATFPGGRYPHLFAFVLAPAAGRTLEEVEGALALMLARLQSQPVDDATLARAKAQARIRILERLEQNAGAAALLATVFANFGDCHRIFAELDDLNRATALDVQRVAVKYFVTAHRTMVYAGLTGPGTPVAEPGSLK